MTQPDATCQVQPNVPLMRKILEQIEADPSLLIMDNWATDLSITSDATQYVKALLTNRGLVNTCGTTRCIAGWAAEFTGWTPQFTSSRTSRSVSWALPTSRLPLSSTSMTTSIGSAPRWSRSPGNDCDPPAGRPLAFGLHSAGEGP
jgi:hypothetical protein